MIYSELREAIASFMTNEGHQKLWNATSNLLEDEVLAVGCVVGISVAEDSDSEGGATAYAHKTNRVRFHTIKERMLCVVTKTQICVFALKEDTSSCFAFWAEFDRQTATIEYQPTTLRGTTTFEIQENSVHATIEYKVCSANYSPAIVKNLK